MSAHTTPVPMLQNEAEFDRLLDLYRQRAPHRVLEVGTYHGGTLYHWLTNAADGAIVVSVDHHVHADNRHLFPTWARSDVQLHVISGDSTDPATAEHAAEHAPYDWIFIDADHHDVSVRADWRLYGALAAPGAVVAFHDITPGADPAIQVAPLWAELALNEETREIKLTNGFGIGIVFIPSRREP